MAPVAAAREAAQVFLAAFLIVALVPRLEQLEMLGRRDKRCTYVESVRVVAAIVTARLWDRVVKGPGTPEAPTVKSFQSLVGTLLWVARCTRPDIAFAVHCATRRAHVPTCNDYRLAKKIARYLAGSAGAKLRMYDDAGPGLPLRMTSYTDADYAGDKIDRKSVSGGILMVNGMTVGWHCKKQSAITLSTAEAEFVAASVGAKELLGVRELAGELGLPVTTPMTMYMDNQAAIKQVENEASSSQAKHVDVRLKFVRDYSAKNIVKPVYIETKKMLADILTKALPAPRLFELRTEIGVE